MVISVLSEAVHPQRDELKFASITNGEQSVTTSGTTLMPVSLAVRLVSHLRVPWPSLMRGSAREMEALF